MCHHHFGALAEGFEFDNDRRLHVGAWWDARRVDAAPLATLVARAWNDPGYAARVVS